MQTTAASSFHGSLNYDLQTGHSGRQRTGRRVRPPGRPAGVDHQGGAVNCRCVVGGQERRGSGHFIDAEEIPAGRRHRPHHPDVFLVSRSAQMDVQGCGDVAGRQRIDVDIELPEFGGQRLSEVFQSGLRGAVSRAVRERPNAGDRSAPLRAASVPDIHRLGFLGDALIWYEPK